ncbi:MAG: DUF3833 family protein [Hyphomicrobiaceae bacterium]
MAQDITPDTAATHPTPPSSTRFELTTFFEGRTVAWGIFEDRFGRMRRRFQVEMQGCWHGDVFHLEEKFVYDTGDTELRTWIVTPAGDGRFTASCADCVGGAVGVCDRQSIKMRYRFRLALSGRNIIVEFDDRIYCIDQDRAVNRAVMRKWGIKLGELSLFFQRESVATHASPERPVAKG